MVSWINKFLLNNHCDPIEDDTFDSLPFCLRIMLESCCRNYNGKQIKISEILKFIDWQSNVKSPNYFLFKSARVMLKDFTAIPIICDLATVRDRVNYKSDHNICARVKPQCLVDLFVDHSLQTEISIPGHGKCSNFKMFGDTCPFHRKECSMSDSIRINEENEFKKYNEHYKILKWASETFDNVSTVPPGLCTPHHFNVKFMARFVVETNNLMYPDSVVGTDGNLSILNGLGILSLSSPFADSGSAVLGLALSVTVNEIVGCRIFGDISEYVNSTDVVLDIIRRLRESESSLNFVEFFGPSVSKLTVNERMVIANMCSEFGAVVAYFPPDDTLIEYIRPIFGHVVCSRFYEYLKSAKLFRSDSEGALTPRFSRVIDVDLSSIQSFCSLRKQKCPMDGIRPFISQHITQNFNIVSLGYPRQCDTGKLRANVVSASIMHYTNHTVSSVILAAGLMARNAFEAGFSVKSNIKCCLLPGNSLSVPYLLYSGTYDSLTKIGFMVVGYGCSECIQNYEKLKSQESEDAGLLRLAVSSKNHESLKSGSINDLLLVSPLYVVAYALVGDALFDFDSNPIGFHQKTKNPVFLSDIWPSRSQIDETIKSSINPQLYTQVSKKIQNGSFHWNNIQSRGSLLYDWNSQSTCVLPTPFLYNDFEDKSARKLKNISNARAMLMMGDDVVSGLIAPAGSIPRNSQASQFLLSSGLAPRDLGSYGFYRGSHQVMVRGMFCNPKLDCLLKGNSNLLDSRTSSLQVVHYPTLDVLPLYLAGLRYQKEGVPLIIFAGHNFGGGAPRDWMAKGLVVLGIRVVVARSMPEWYRFDLISVGIIPLCFQSDSSLETLELVGNEIYDIRFPFVIEPCCTVQIMVDQDSGFDVTLSCVNDFEITLLHHGGVLQHCFRNYAN